MGELVPFPVSRCVGFLRENVQKIATSADPLKAIEFTVARYAKRLELMGVEPELARNRVGSMRGALRFYTGSLFGSEDSGAA